MQTEDDGLGTIRDRSPHPYLRRSSTLRDDRARDLLLAADDDDKSTGSSRRSSADQDGSPPTISTGSESGTEADDEKPHYLTLKALPPPTHRPRKGLKGRSRDVSPLITPSQLDFEGRRLSESYFDSRQPGADASWEQKELEAERQRYQQRKLAERIRRLSEGALLGIIGLIVGVRPLLQSPSWFWDTGGLMYRH